MKKKLFIKEWDERIKEDNELQKLIGSHNFQFLLKCGQEEILWSIKDGVINYQKKYSIDDVWHFTVVIPDDAWQKFIQSPPPAFHTTLQAMIANVHGVKVEGDRIVWAQCIEIVERILYLARRPNETLALLSDQEFSPESINGHYINIEIGGQNYTIYYEEAGKGHPIIFLHTAGSDSRQFKYLLGNKKLQEKWHMYTFDLPYHGKSNPPNNWWEERYQLTTELYTNWILAFMKATNLYDKKPVISGASMGGAIVLFLAAEYGSLFKGVISIEGGFGRSGRMVSWTNHPKVHAGNFIASWVGGLFAPDSPEYYRRLTLWEYSQGGPGIYQGDMYFYSHDFPKATRNIGKAQCPLWILTGDYDYSCTVEMSKEAADRLGGKFIKLEGMGHFPMSEKPREFLSYLEPVLNEICRL